MPRLRVLVVANRSPDPAGKGDQTRTHAVVEALEEAGHDVTLVVPDPGPVGRALGAAGALLRGSPAQVGWAMPQRCWRRVLRTARVSDVVVARTARCVRSPVPCPLLVDHADCLSRNMRVRALQDPRRALRVAARLEGRLMARHERRLARWADRQSAVTETEASALPGAVDVLPIHHAGRVLDDPPGGRDIDVILSGVMTYPPNRLAALRLANEIAPALRARRPQARIVVAGRGAAALRGIEHVVEVCTDVPDLLSLLNRAKVAIAPMSDATGAQNKLVEAACAGCAIVASPSAAGPLGYDAAVGTSSEELGALVVRLLEDPDEWERVREAGRHLIRDHDPALFRARVEELVAAVAREGSQPSRNAA